MIDPQETHIKIVMIASLHAVCSRSAFFSQFIVCSTKTFGIDYLDAGFSVRLKVGDCIGRVGGCASQRGKCSPKENP